MKAAVKAGKERFDIVEAPIPGIGKDECLIQIRYNAICVWDYEEWLRDGTDDIFGPGVNGHEMSGVIVKIGSNVSRWHEGDKVLTYFFSNCGVCPECLKGKQTYCRNKPGPDVCNGYAEYVAAHTNCILPLPEDIDMKKATLISDMVGTAMHAIRRAFSVNLERKIVTVWGLGPVGLFVVQGLRTIDGIEKIIALDTIKSRCDLALELGATEVYDPTWPDLEKMLKSENNGLGVDYAFNCAIRNPEKAALAYNTLRNDGYIMNVTGSVLSSSQTEKRIDSTYYFNTSEYDENFRLVQQGRFNLDRLITHEFTLDEINEGMRIRSLCPDKSLKVIIKCT